MLKRSLLQALCAAVCVLALTGCGDECVDQFDCRNKEGPPPEGKEYLCVKNECELRDETPDEVTCSPECAASEFCDTSSGEGVCRTCSETQGCTAPLFCDVEADNGKGVCRACADTAQGNGTDQGCSATAPVCDAADGSGAGVCKVCLNSAQGSSTDLGCSDTTPICETSVGNNAGQCKSCLDSAQGDGTDLGCSDTIPFCNATAGSGAGQCTVCTDSAAEGGTDQGCSETAPLCDLTAGNGAGACLVCRDTAAPGSGTDDQGCSSPTSICDPEANSGAGVCKVCTSTQGCTDPLECNAEGTACVGCTGDDSCASTPATPVCKIPPNVCVECVDNTQCSATKPACNTTTNFCGCTTNADCASETSDTDFCATAANNGRGECKVCVTDANCASVDPSKPVCENQTACVGCLTNAHCSLTQVCNTTSKTCENVPGADPATTSGRIGSVNTSPAGPLASPITVENAFVTYIKPAVGADVTGFFLQAEADGPALFVSSDPSTLQVGDRVTLTVNEVVELSGKVKAATNITGLTLSSRGHPVQNLSTGTFPGLAVDRSAAANLASAVDTYLGEIIRLTGTMTGPLEGSGTGHSAIPVTTAGVTTGTSLKLRMPTTLANQYELGANCTFTLDVGPMWKFVGTTTTTAQPSAYSREDFSALACPAPRLVGLVVPSNTTVKVIFDRSIDPASITDAAAQFTFTPSDLSVTAAVVNGKEVTLTTSSQAGGATYTLSVASTVTDTLGTGVATPNSATFTTFLAVHGARLAIAGTGFTGASGVTIGDQAQPFTVDSDTQITITGVTDTAPLGSQPVVVTTPGGPVTIGNTQVVKLVINEFDPDTPGADAAEFVEISTGAPNIALSGFVLVLFNGADDKSYLAIDLAATSDANGFIVAGNPGVTQKVLTFPDNTLQNGADGIAIYQGSSAAFPNGTAASATGLIDAAVHGTADPNDGGLLDTLLFAAPDPRRVQVDESETNSAAESIQRCAQARRDGRVFNVAAPSPGAPNVCP